MSLDAILAKNSFEPTNYSRGYIPSFYECIPDIPIHPYISPLIDGGLRIDIDRSTPNTVIIKEDIGQIRNTYIHHDKGPGRVETNINGNVNKTP